MEMTEERAYVQSLIDKARAAQQIFETFPQEKVDAAVRAVGKAVYDHGAELAEFAVKETRMGIYEDKIVKNQGKAKAVWQKLKGVKSRGILRYLDDQGLVEVAKPMGIIGSICPTTNPNMTPMHNAMIALKGGNALIVCPHPRAKESGVKTCNYMRQALEEVGAPVDLIQCIPEPSIELSNMVMNMCDVCISTGGPAMVKAAYSSGKPAFGVGAGNLQALIDRSANLAEAVPMLVAGRIYDAGVLCTCEQTSIVPREKAEEFLSLMKKERVYYTEDEGEIEALRQVIFPEGKTDPNIVGQPAPIVAAKAGITVPDDTRMLLVRLQKYGRDELLAMEKLLPVMGLYLYDTWEEAVAIAKANLLYMGAGHSVVIHSNTKENIEYAAVELPVSRFSVNQQGSSSLGGALVNGLNPTGTLGCGSWGNNSISENLWWNHLVNISRIAYRIPGIKVPTDEEIWGE